MNRRGFAVFTLILILSACASSRPAGTPHAAENSLQRAWLSRQNGLPVVYLEGSSYEIGYQHGRLLQSEVRRANDQLVSYFARKLKVPVLGKWIVYWMLDRAYGKLRPNISADYFEEMRGLADGSGVPLKQIHRLHAVPDLYSTLCSSGTFFGGATTDGALYQFRNLDWNREIGIQEYGCVFIVKKEGKAAFANLGFVSFIGALSGMNENGISIAQIGSESRDQTLKGTPMPFLLRRVLEEAGDLDTAVAIVRDAKRTVGINYVFGDAVRKRACAVETTATKFEVFYDNDGKEMNSPYALPAEDAVMRADFAANPAIRDLQTCAHGKPEQPGPEDPRGSSAYDVRYAGQAAFLKENYGKIDAAGLLRLAKIVAPPSNVQSVVYAFPDFYVAYAEGNGRAADRNYEKFNLQELLKRKKTAFSADKSGSGKT